jgi:cystathionine gamma-synthase
MSKSAGLNTLCVHSARAPERATGALAQPIYLATTFERDADGGYPRGYRYSREGTPNRDSLESCIAGLEGGIGAAAFSSGLAANMAVLELLQPGERLIAARGAYYGSVKQFTEHTSRRGVSVELTDFNDRAAVESALKRSARLVWIETPTNPLLDVTAIEAVTALAHRGGALVVCDNTFVIHSGTKYLGGHSDVLSGFAVVRQDRGVLEHLQAWQRMAGSALAPFDCWLLRRSIATLALRVRTQCAGALQVAQFLARHPAIEKVFYPGLPQHPAHTIAAAQMPGGFGAVLSMCVSGGQQAALHTAARTHLFTRATSLGSVESLIEHRASIEGPQSLTPKNLLRLSIGIEEPEDLIADLTQALE